MSWHEKAASQLLASLPPGSRVLIAVSGGPDSVALAHVLRGTPYRLILGHVNHRLRSGSNEDARFVRCLAQTWDLPFRSKTVNVRAYARLQGLGLEEAAREVRYRALAAMAQKDRCAAILTAHSADDQSETVLMNFLRGSGPAGLAGIPWARPLTDARNLRLLRPFLGVRRREIMRYLQHHSLSYRTDPTNRLLRFTRNRIRHETLPSLEKHYPGLADRLAQASDIFRREEDFWQRQVLRELRKTVRKDGQRITVVLPQLLRYHKALSRRILRHILPGLSFQDIERVFDLARSPQQTAGLELSRRWHIRRLKNTLVVHQKRME